MKTLREMIDIIDNCQNCLEAKDVDFDTHFKNINLLTNIYRKGADQWTPEDLAAVKQAVKALGRRVKIDLGWMDISTGQIMDAISRKFQQDQIKSGKGEFNASASTTEDMARQIAAFTNGKYERTGSSTWSTSRGDRYRDAADHVMYSDQESFDDAWQWIRDHGKQVHYNVQDNVRTGIQIGKYLIDNSSTVSDVFGKNPHTYPRISVRTINSLGNYRKKQDITDQQAATLRDIAQTRNANHMQQLKAIVTAFDAMKNMREIKQSVDSSEKIDPKVKSILDNILAKGMSDDV